eukprot:Gb_09220 [translate_table: standard]
MYNKNSGHLFKNLILLQYLPRIGTLMRLKECQKEIEVRVATSRLLQQRIEVSSVILENISNQLAISNQQGDYRKPMDSCKISSAVSMEDKIKQVRPYGYAIDAQKRHKLLQILVEDLKVHWALGKDNLSIPWNSLVKL